MCVPLQIEDSRKIETSAGEDFIIFTKRTGKGRTIYLHFEETGNTDCEDPAVGVQASNVLQWPTQCHDVSHDIWYHSITAINSSVIIFHKMNVLNV